MAGIEDVQPKQLSTMGQPLVSPFTSQINQDAVQKLVEGFKSGYINTTDIINRNKEMEKKDLEITALQQATSPVVQAAREETAKAAAEKAFAERETMLTKDFVDAYRRYNLPLLDEDGKPDYKGMAEVGQKYADMERLLKYAEIGSTPAGQPRVWVDEKGQHTAIYNAFGEDITQVPGQPNRILEEHQKNARRARAFLLQNDNEPEVPEGKTAPQIKVSPKVMPAPATPEAFPMRTVVTPGPVMYVPPTPAPVAVVPATPPTPAVVPVPASAPPVQPTPEYVPGTGFISGPGTFKADEAVKDMRTQELYKNWAEKSAKIDELRALETAYAQKPKVTKQLDLDLAQAALMLSMPSSGGSGRGMPEMRLEKLADAQPLIEKAYHIVPQMLGTESFTPDTRARLIAAAERKAQALESIARSPIQTTVDRLKKVGQDPAKYLDSKELQLLGSAPAAGGPAPVGGATRQITLSNGKIVTVTVQQ